MEIFVRGPILLVVWEQNSSGRIVVEELRVGEVVNLVFLKQAFPTEVTLVALIFDNELPSNAEIPKVFTEVGNTTFAIELFWKAWALAANLTSYL